MPLKSGKSNIGPNIRELERPSKHAPGGRSYEQALAIALKTAGVPKRANGGHVGALRGKTMGRADEILTSVADGSHIIPADITSALGDGNSEAGFAKLEKIFPSQRALGGRISGMKGMKGILGSRMPKMPRMPSMKFSRGGAVPVKLSDGEFAIAPEHVTRVGGGDIERGHRCLDHWIVSTRKADIERRKRLPGPVQS
jgi:hypothetical protein